MPAPQVDRRPDVLTWAKAHGWQHEKTKGFDGEVLRDVFTKGDMELRCFWLVTPFSEALWARAYLLRPYRAVTVPRVTSSGTRPSVESVLKQEHTKAQ